MIQKVLKVGTSLAVTIPKGSLRELGLDSDSKVTTSVDTKKKVFSIRAIAKPKKDKNAHITKLTLDFIRRYRKDLEKLAE